MDQSALLKIVVGNKYDLDPTASYLSALPGAAGIVGFDRIGEKLDTATKGRESAQREASRLAKIVDAGARKYAGLGANDPLTKAQREVFQTDVTATGDDAPRVIVPMPPSGIGSTTPAAGESPLEAFLRTNAEREDRTLKLLLEILGKDTPEDATPDVPPTEAFAKAFRAAYDKVFRVEKGPDLDEAGVAWAAQAAQFLSDVKGAHIDADTEETGAFTWALSRLTPASPSD